MLSDATLRVLTGPEATAGMRWGAVAASLAAIAGVAARHRSGGTAPVVGVLLAAAAVGGLWSVERLDGLLPLALALLVVGGWLASWSRLPHVAGVLGVLPGAVVLLETLPPGPPWVAPAVLVLVAVGGPLVAAGERARPDDALFTTLLAASVLGIFFAVPDTEHIAVVLGAMIPLAAVGWPLRLARIGPGASAALAAVAVAAVHGGSARPPSIVGALFTVGLLVVLPLSGSAHRTSGSLYRVLETTARGRTVIIGLHLSAIVVTARLAAPASSVPAAAMIGVFAIAVLVLLGGTTAGRGPDERVPSEDAPSARGADD